jgi:hypothetical protein
VLMPYCKCDLTLQTFCRANIFFPFTQRFACRET